MQTPLDMIQTVRVTGSEKVTSEKCYLYSVLLTGDAVGKSDAALYNGVNASGDVLFDLKAADDASFSIVFNRPVVFTKGLFISIGTNVTSVTVCIASVED